MTGNIKSVVNIGENIEIEVNVDDNSSMILKSNIIEIIDSNTVIISAPIHKGNVFPITTGNNIKIIFYKKNTGKFYFIGEVIRRDKRNNLFILYVNCKSKIRRTQRRDYFRLNILLNMEISVLDDNLEKPPIPCITKDMSGGGLRVISKEKINLYSLVKCKIPLDDESLTIIGKIVRSDKVPESIAKWDLGIEFMPMDEGIRSKIISFIFDKQRKLIKKGLI